TFGNALRRKHEFGELAGARPQRLIGGNVKCKGCAHRPRDFADIAGPHQPAGAQFVLHARRCQHVFRQYADGGGDQRPAHGLGFGGGSSAGTTTTSQAPSAAGMSLQWPTKRQSVSMPCSRACLRRLRAYCGFIVSLPTKTKAMLRLPLATISRAASITLICPFHGAMRPGTSTTRMSGRTAQTRRRLAMRSALTAAGLNAAVSTARGMTVMRSAGSL